MLADVLLQLISVGKHRFAKRARFPAAQQRGAAFNQFGGVVIDQVLRGILCIVEFSFTLYLGRIRSIRYVLHVPFTLELVKQARRDPGDRV